MELTGMFIFAGLFLFFLILWLVSLNRVKKMNERINTVLEKGRGSRNDVRLPLSSGSWLSAFDSLNQGITEADFLLTEAQTSMASATAKELMAEKMRFAQLQNQINPHFLYNTLENIRAKAIIDDNLVIADMTEALSRYFRYNISKGEDIVPLSAELENIQLYMKMQKYRFADRFTFDIVNHDEDNLISQCMIPKMTLQPIVENAIFHGIEKKLDKGHIAIHIEAGEKHVILYVEDDGVGMDRETLLKLQEKLSSAPQEAQWVEKKQGDGVAMQNVNNRLKLLYGEEFGLTVSSTPGIGTEVRLVIPLIIREEKSSH